MTESHRKRLFLLDGMALIYRAYFGFFNAPIRTSTGFNTSALVGFINTLLQLQDVGKPTHIAVAFDTSVPTARHILYPPYKANRESMPEELSAQIPHLFRLLEALNIPILRLEGYEADDTIGTIAKMAENTNEFDTFMVTPDKDFGQLIDTHTFMWKPGRKGSDYSIINLESLKEEWNIQRADQVIDILGLMGDSADNIPGVPSIGPKTAKALIAQFNTIENLLDHTQELKGKRKEVIENFAEQARLSKTLATINIKVPLPFSSLDDLICKEPNLSAIKTLCDEFEFRTLKKRLLGEGENTTKTKGKKSTSEQQRSLFDLNETPEEVDLFSSNNQLTQVKNNIRTTTHSYHTIKTSEERKNLAQILLKQDSWCFDTETSGLDPLTDKLLGISFSWKAHEAFYVVISSPQDLEPFIPVFASSAEKIGHNLKFDLGVLLAQGINVEGPFWDTMLVHSLIAPGNKHSMDYLSEILLDYTPISLIDIASGDKKNLDVEHIDTDILAEYGAEDADITYQLAQKLRPKLIKSEQEKVYLNLEAPLISVLAHMEHEGIRLDTDALSKVEINLSAEITKLKTRILKEAGHDFNLNSPKQLGTVLFDELELVAKPKKTKTGQYVTDEETLTKLSHFHPIVADILAYREAYKLKGTYVDTLPKYVSPADGRIHTQYLQLITATGRMASQDPNLQNIPIRSEAGKGIRASFIARSEEYTLLSADYSQIELRIMAALSGDEGMLKAFKSGRDIHTETASKIYNVPSEEVSPDMRRAAKTVNFGIIYGISAFGLSQRLSIPRNKAAEIIDNYFSQFPKIKIFMDKLIKKAKETGYVYTLNGRRRFLPDINSNNANIRQGAERMAINTPIQGSAADMIKMAMIKVQKFLDSHAKKSKLLLQIHDELVIDLHKDERNLIPQIVSIMEQAMPLPHDVPALVEANTGHNWLKAH